MLDEDALQVGAASLGIRHKTSVVRAGISSRSASLKPISESLFQAASGEQVVGIVASGGPSRRSLCCNDSEVCEGNSSAVFVVDCLDVGIV